MYVCSAGQISAVITSYSIHYTKLYEVVNYYSAHSKKEIIPLIFPVLFSSFSRVLIFHSLKDRTDSNVVAMLKTYPGYVRDFRAAAALDNAGACMNIITLIRSYDLNAKGFGEAGSDTGDLLKELVITSYSIHYTKLYEITLSG